ncbi:MAG: PAS domain-containing hybrid sensor histidine kinase/response regulator, partial [Sphingomonadales bacterium]
MGHWRSDRARDIFVWSPEVYRILGISPDLPPSVEMIRSRYHPDDIEKADFLLAEALRTGAMPPTRLRWIRPDGKLIHIESAAAQIGPSGMIGIMRDVTEQVETERSLIATRDQARSAERAKAELLAVMSHEIRSPLNGLLNSIESLRRNPSDAQRQPLLESLNDAACTVLSVVDDMLD